MSEAGQIISPTDDAWYIADGVDFSISSAAVLGKDRFTFLATLEGKGYDLGDEYTRVYRYEDGKWSMFWVDFKIHQIIKWQPDNWQKPGVALLCSDRTIRYLGEQPSEEAVIDSSRGLEDDVDGLRQCGENLIAFGWNGQLYLRSNGVWSASDNGMYGSLPPAEKQTYFTSLQIRDTLIDSHGVMYACGVHGAITPVLYYKEKIDTTWKKISLPDRQMGDRLTMNGIEKMLIDDSGDIITIGSIGIVLRGNWQKGFNVIGDFGYPGKTSLESIERYKDDVYVGCQAATYRIAGGQFAGGVFETASGPISRNVTGGNTVAIDGHILKASDDSLWAFGWRGISRFDGRTWERIPIPPIYRTKK